MKKRGSFIGMLMAALLGGAIAFGAVGGLFSGFELEISAWWMSVFAVALAAVLGAIGARIRFGWIGALVLSLGGTLAFVRLASLTTGLTAVIDRVTMTYEEAYGWASTTFFADPYFVKDFSVPFLWLTTLTALWLAYGIAKGINPLIVIGVSAVFVIPCLVATDTPPDGKFAFVWIATAVTLLLSVSGQQTRTALRARRTLTTAVAVIAATAVLFVALPPDAEYDQKHEWRDHILHRFGLNSGSEDNDHTTYNRAPVEEIEEAGYPRGTQMVMKILASNETTVYLREQDYSTYDGARWSSHPERYDSLRMGNTADWYLSVQTPVNYARKFVPYYPASRADLEGGNLRNMKRDTEYTWKVAELDEDWKARVEAMAEQMQYTPPSVEYVLPEDYLPSLDDDLFIPDETNDFVMMPPPIYGHEDAFEVTIAPQWDMWMEGRFAEYLALPEATAAWAQTVIEPLVDSDMTYTSKADAIAEFVKGQARYVEFTYSSPDEGEDYAQWFLEEYQKGCCVHFATTTAVLLRAAGVPTRYVTGYARNVKRTTWTAVLETHAHSWVEYYEPILGQWIRLEATPAAALGVQEEETTESTDVDTTVTTQVQEETTVTTAPQTPVEQMAAALPWKEILLVGGTLLLLVALIAGQRAVRLACRRKRREKAPPNARARLLWHDAVRLAKRCGEEPPERLFELAQKAAFSRHTMSEEELAAFKVYTEDVVARLCTRSIVHRLWYRWVLALY